MDGGLFENLRREKSPGRSAKAVSKSNRAPDEHSVSNPVRTVSQVNHMIQEALSAQLPAVLLVRGEISNYSVSQKGHVYFTLKDPQAELGCVMWRSDAVRLNFTPQNGLAVIAQGAVRIYEPQGRIQFYAGVLYPQGAGALELAFRQLCEKLRSAGLFDAARKRPIPRLPGRVVIITSPTGDVLHDVLITAYRRFPGLHSMVFPTAVQGAAAAPQIVRAIELVNQHADQIGGVDLILLVRGGGSIEDLWAFNEESVARAIVQSRIPIATGIGHEPDVTIADLVADLRGPTPTGVTELTIPDVAVLNRELLSQARHLSRDVMHQTSGCRGELKDKTRALTDEFRSVVFDGARTLENFRGQIQSIEPRHAIAQGWRRIETTEHSLFSGVSAVVGRLRTDLATWSDRLHAASPESRLARADAGLESLKAALVFGAGTLMRDQKHRLDALVRNLELTGPQAVLQRGFTITTDRHGAVIRQAAQAIPGERINTQTADGAFASVIAPMHKP
ncbi:MAG TPA: exodeoxyribonuclease VII large subunit [Phycisphaerae bacterium]|nr:exodeoxyribonuclease VII large subunit [Phycisphaerae bacterium]